MKCTVEVEAVKRSEGERAKTGACAVATTQPGQAEKKVGERRCDCLALVG